jgi:hypothetical protein
MRRLIVSCALWLSIISNVSAAPASWVDAGKITRIHSGHGTGSFLFSTEVNVKVQGCNDGLGYVVKDDATNSNRIYTILLAAYASGKPVSIYVSGLCIMERPEVNAVQIRETPYF